ncbi:Colicin V production protein [hydrothermal vent metagenome]|uniref:Colicin V production protein n=1 Tax=hydrothermal vent metagenome TaxID=652676 RepID=A0A1W1E824_9ZZZZ
MPDFNYFDVTLGAIILLLAIKGFMNGVIKEVFGLAGLVGGVYFASRLAPEAATFIDKTFVHIDNASLLKLIGFMSVLIIIWLSATILGSIISKLTSQSGLGFLDRLLGLIAGGGKYFIIFALIVTALSNVTLIRDNMQKYLKDSMLYPILYKAGSAIIKIDPASIGLKVGTSHTSSKKDANASSADNTQ